MENPRPGEVRGSTEQENNEGPQRITSSNAEIARQRAELDRIEAAEGAAQERVRAEFAAIIEGHYLALHARSEDALDEFLSVIDDPSTDRELGLDEDGNREFETAANRLVNDAMSEGRYWLSDVESCGVLVFLTSAPEALPIVNKAHLDGSGNVRLIRGCWPWMPDFSDRLHAAGLDREDFAPLCGPLKPTAEAFVELTDSDSWVIAETEDVEQIVAVDDPLAVLDLRKRNEPRNARVWLENLLVAVGQVTKITAASGVGKTLLLAYLALCWSLGRSGLDVENGENGEHGEPRALARPLRVLYIDGEVGEDWWFEYLDKMDAPFELPNLLVKSFPDWPPLTTDAGARLFWGLVEHHSPDVVILDTLSSFIDGDENDSSTWIAFDNRITLPLKANGITALFADHTGKIAELGARGSSAKKSKIDVEWSVEASPKGSNGLLLRNLKARTGKLPDMVRLIRKDDPLTHARSGSESGSTSPLRSVSQSGEPVDPKVAEVVRVLDKLNIDPKSGRPTIAKRLRSEGVTASDEAIRAAIEHRRQRADKS
ncbi:hypothetical protein A5N83_14880 [Rhodococcus sp. 1139]|nr:hypothetical protein A5N83_14880 [Rhodococcus sp. 1139]